MNALLAIVIYYVFLGLSGFKTELPLLGDYKFFGVNQAIKEDIYISGVSEGSPAQKAGMKEFDKILTFNGQRVETTEYFTGQIRENKGKEVTLSWQNEKTGERSSATITPRTNPPKNEGALGVSFFPVETIMLSYDTPLQRVFSGVIHPANLLVYNLDVMGELIQTSVEQKSAEPIGGAVAGPVGIFKVVEQFLSFPDIKDRFLQLLNLAGLLSVSLALFNILPIPALDGGRLFFILIEGISGKKVNPKYETLAHTIGMMVLLTLLLVITAKDIFQFILPQ